jgi:hypothetical protein
MGPPTGRERRYRQLVEIGASVWDDMAERPRIEGLLRRRGLKVVAFRPAQEENMYRLIAIEED